MRYTLSKIFFSCHLTTLDRSCQLIRFLSGFFFLAFSRGIPAEPANGPGFCPNEYKLDADQTLRFHPIHRRTFGRQRL